MRWLTHVANLSAPMVAIALCSLISNETVARLVPMQHNSSPVPKPFHPGASPLTVSGSSPPVVTLSLFSETSCQYCHRCGHYAGRSGLSRRPVNCDTNCHTFKDSLVKLVRNPGVLGQQWDIYYVVEPRNRTRGIVVPST